MSSTSEDKMKSADDRDVKIVVPVVHRMRSFMGPSVWLEFTPLANLMDSVNLGQGSPGWGAPPFVTQALTRAATDDAYSQYSNPTGNPILRSAIARAYSPRLEHTIDPITDVLVTVGASQAISLVCHALLQDGDEVVLIEPAFDMYIGGSRMAGATPVYVPLRVRASTNTSASSASELYLDMEEFAAAFTPRTRMLIMNSPHNPTGKVFTRAEQVAIAEILDEKCPNCIVMSDEVYEHLSFSSPHVPFATVSRSAQQRTLSVYSAGKTFSITGWKIGWIISANTEMMRQIRIAQQFIVFSVCNVTQAAVAEALDVAESPYNGLSNYYNWLREHYRGKRDFLVSALTESGMRPIIPDGAFYVLAKVPKEGPLGDIVKAGFPEKLEELLRSGALEIDPGTKNSKDYNICRNLTIKKGVAAIPPSAFFSEEHRVGNTLAEDYARFAFCKTDAQLEEAKRRLQQ